MDLETFCVTDLRSHGAFKYAEKAEVMLWSYALVEGDIKLWDLTADKNMPADLKELLYNPDVLTVWHNGMSFDRTVLRHALGLDIPVERVWDTMAQAYAHSLPGSLDTLGEVLGLAQDMRKLKEGKALIQLFCVPKKGEVARFTRHTHPEKWAEFCEYAKRDIAAMRELFKIMPRGNFNAEELKVYRLDAKINARGVNLDIELCEAAIRATDLEQVRLRKETRRLGSEAVFADDATVEGMGSATQRDRVLDFILAEYGLKLEDLTKATVGKLLDDPDVPEGLKELLAIRRGATTTSVKKYKKFLQWACKDGRLRGALQYCGALRTGRWAGRGPQLQNLTRPQWGGKPMNEDAIEGGLLDRMAGFLKDDNIDMIAPDVMEACSALVRGVIIPSKGKKLVVADLAGIESRVLAYLAGEEWVLKASAAYDAGEGPDLYKVTYSNMFNIPLDKVTKTQRQTGKVMLLACIAEGQLVLTDCGNVPIQSVTKDMMLWDGNNFVSHDGVIFKGEKEVISYDGLTATKEHIVWVKGESRPIQFGIAASSGSRLLESRQNGYGKKEMLENNTIRISMARTYDILNSGPHNRFTVSGKLVHNCGYQGGVGAVVTMASSYKMDLQKLADAALPTLPLAIRSEAEDMYEWALEKNAKAEANKRKEDTIVYDSTFGLSKEIFTACDGLKRVWRLANPNIVAFWGQMDNAIRNSIVSPRVNMEVGNALFPNPKRPKLYARTDGAWTKMVMPSGRSLYYPSMAISQSGELTYLGQHQITKKWCRLKNYAGKEAEQVTQAFSRELMAHGMLLAEEAGYEVVLTVHDEIISEAPDNDLFTAKGLEDLMSTVPKYANGLPLSASGFEAYRYRK